jgi:hypothetical protein
MYLIIDTRPGEESAFFTHFYSNENLWQPGMIVIDCGKDLVSFDGKTWEQITEDIL